MIQSGFTIVFGGPEFRPEDFLQGSPLSRIATAVQRGDRLRSWRVAEDSWLEFSDVREGTYPLDLVAEAVDFLGSHREEFQRLTRFPGVEWRTLNFFGDAESCTTEFNPDAIALLHGLALHVSIVAMPTKKE